WGEIRRDPVTGTARARWATRTTVSNRPERCPSRVKNAVWLVLALCLFTSCSSEKGEPNASGRPEVAAPSGVPTPTSNVSVAPADPAWPEDEAAQGYRNAIGTVTAELAKLSEMSPKAGLRKTQGALR